MKTAVILLSIILGLAAATEPRDAALGGNSPRLCYSCEGVNCQRETRQNATVACNDQLDICVTVYDGFRVSERGCLLGLSLAGQDKCAAKPHLECQKCNGQLCNNRGRIDFKCLQCDGADDSACNTAADTLTPSQCAAPTSSNSYCYVQVVGTNMQRGCALTLKEQEACLSSADCRLCLPEHTADSAACNTYSVNVRSGAAQGQLRVGLLLWSLVGLLSVRVFP